MSCAESYVLSVIRGRPGILPALLRGLLSALALLYTAGLEAYLLQYRIGLRRRTRLAVPVICVGNLTTGGTGKTPFTILVCRVLAELGFRCVVLSRGYRSAFEHGAAVVSDESQMLLQTEQSGDEPALLARALPGVPVVIGKDRRVTGRLALERFRPDVLVLDDGLQFWQLHRDLDIVLLNAAAPFDNGWTLPRGLLREPPTHLSRAGLVVLTNADAAGREAVRTLTERVGRLAPAARVCPARLVATELYALTTGSRLSLEWLRDRRVLAASAIGNPQSFARLLVSQGAEVVESAVFPDHDRISDATWRGLAETACRLRADGIVTTEKDAVKVLDVASASKLYWLRVDMQIDDSATLISVLQQAVRRSQGA